jgi:uncharacterized spore protein YtfJ
LSDHAFSRKEHLMDSTGHHEQQPVPPPPHLTKANGEILSENVDVPAASGLLDQIIEGVVGKALSHADVHTVFGDPVTHGDLTIIPVARVTANYGFGAGSGQGEGEGEDKKERQRGSGGGGGGGRVKASPIGYIEMTNGSANFVPIVDRTTMLTTLATIAGVALILTLPGLLRSRDSDHGKRRARRR